MKKDKIYIPLWDVWKEFNKNRGPKAKLVIIIFRMANYFTSNNIILKPIGFVFFILNKFINEMLFCVEIPYKTRIKRGLTLWHPHCVVINSACEIGENFVIRQCCTLGANKKGAPERFVVGDNVSMSINSAIISDNITIGNNVTVGAGVILMKSIEGNSYVINEKNILIKKKM